MNYIEERNSLGLSYWLGETEHTDIAYEEFLEKYTGEIEVDNYFMSMINDPEVEEF